MDAGAFTFIDFRKLFIQYPRFARAPSLKCSPSPPPHVTIVIHLFHALIALIIYGGVQLSSLIRPTSGVRQGCPLSPTLFAMLISPIISKLYPYRVKSLCCYISRGHPVSANTERICNFSGIFQVLVQCTKMLLPRGGGGYM